MEKLNLKKYSQYGFTMIEMLTVVAVIGVLAIAVILGLRAFGPNFQLRGISREISSDLRYIQQLTITEQQEYCFKIFSSGELKYQIFKCDEPATIIKENIMPGDITSFTPTSTGFTDDTIEYNPYGAVAEEGIIYLENSRGEVRNILVRPSGFIKLTN